MIRRAQVGDEVAIMQLIQALAEYEKAPNEVVNTAQALKHDLFVDPICEAFVLELDGKTVGFALYYTNYSTWKGRCLYLEDFFILPEYRRGGWGEKLFQEVVNVAKQRGVKRMDWQVLEWNEPAISFYKKQQATLDPEWINGRFFFE